MRKGSRLRKFLLLTLFVLLAGGGFFLIDLWRVNEITCQINEGSCSQELWGQMTSEFVGKSFVFLSPTEASLLIKDKHPDFFKAEIKKVLFNKLFIQIEFRKSIASVAKEMSPLDSENSSEFTAGSDFFLVDEEGFCLERSQENSLPTILLRDEPKLALGQKTEDKSILEVITIIKESSLRLLEPKIARIISKRAIEVWYKGEIKVLFSSEKELRAQLDSLQFIFSRAKIDGKKLSVIDLRFDKPVIQE